MTKFPELDLSVLLTPGEKFAVRCETEDEAKHFVASVRGQFPYKESYLDAENVHWDDDNHGSYGGRAYFPDLNDYEEEPFMHGDLNWAVDYGYTIIYFYELLPQDDINESDEDINVLFGGAL